VRQVGYLQEPNRDARSTKHKIICNEIIFQPLKIQWLLYEPPAAVLTVVAPWLWRFVAGTPLRRKPGFGSNLFRVGSVLDKMATGQATTTTERHDILFFSSFWIVKYRKYNLRTRKGGNFCVCKTSRGIMRPQHFSNRSIINTLLPLDYVRYCSAEFNGETLTLSEPTSDLVRHWFSSSAPMSEDVRHCLCCVCSSAVGAFPTLFVM
jgi:hypothetical protein